MRRYRTVLSLLLGWVFLIQGLAVSAAPLALPEPAALAASAEAPCHGDMAATDSDSADMPCCDDSCPDMTHCVLAQPAVLPQAGVAIERPQTSPHAGPLLQASSHPRSGLLRPPIALHA